MNSRHVSSAQARSTSRSPGPRAVSRSFLAPYPLVFALALTPVCAAPKNAAPQRVEASRTVAVEQESVDALIAKGREKLEAGDGAGAEALFAQAAQADGNTLKTRTWVLRSWLAQARINDTLNELDQLAKSSTAPELDYLYGVAFALDARASIASNSTGPFTGEKIADSLRFIEKALAADAARFRDATVLACWSAWQLQEFDRGRAAADAAAKHWPQNPESFYQLGRFALAQYERDHLDEAKKLAADAHRKTSRAALEQAATMLAGATSADARATLARVSVDLGHIFALDKDTARAVEAYARAIGNDPTLVNYSQLLSALGQEAMLAALEAGEKAFVANWGADNVADAGLLWWLGWSRLQQKQFPEAEQAFAASVKKVPAYVNCWLYIARCRYSTKDFGGAVDALVRYFELDARDLGASLTQDFNFNLPMLDFLVGWCATQKPPRTEHAGVLSEAQAIAKPDELRYWNNAGLFYRDAGEPFRRSADEAKQTRAAELFERAYESYSMALSLAPDDPAILNDTAVMLHYYLDRETERAKEMYKRSNARAAELLKKPDLSRDERELYQTALRDSANNLAKLEKGIKTNG